MKLKHVLVKYKNIKLLINEGCDSQPLFENISEIESLNDKVSDFYKNLMNASGSDSKNIENNRRDLISKIGYNIIGVPFTNHDAELYALDKKLDYEVLELNLSAQQAANRRQDEKRRNLPAFPRTFLDAESAAVRDQLLQIYGTNAEILREGMRLLAEKHQLK